MQLCRPIFGLETQRMRHRSHAGGWCTTTHRHSGTPTQHMSKQITYPYTTSVTKPGSIRDTTPICLPPIVLSINHSIVNCVPLLWRREVERLQQGRRQRENQQQKQQRNKKQKNQKSNKMRPLWIQNQTMRWEALDMAIRYYQPPQKH